MAEDRVELFLDRDMTEPVSLPLAGGCAVVLSARRKGDGGVNEDAAAVIPLGSDRGVLLVADGAGGLRAGAQAAELAARAVVEALEEAPEGPERLRSGILDGFERANRAIREHGVGGATTLAVVGIEGGLLRPYHTGDSVILVTGQRGRRRLLTVSHSPVGYGVEAGLLDDRDALHHEDRHLVSNLVGTPDMRIEVGSALRLAALDTVVLASDGLSDNLHVPEIVDHVRRGPLVKAATTLAAAARTRMRAPEGPHPSKPDDLTFLLFRRGPAGAPERGRG